MNSSINHQCKEPINTVIITMAKLIDSIAIARIKLNKKKKSNIRRENINFYPQFLLILQVLTLSQRLAVARIKNLKVSKDNNIAFYKSWRNYLHESQWFFNLILLRLYLAYRFY